MVPRLRPRLDRPGTNGGTGGKCCNPEVPFVLSLSKGERA